MIQETCFLTTQPPPTIGCDSALKHIGRAKFLRHIDTIPNLVVVRDLETVALVAEAALNTEVLKVRR